MCARVCVGLHVIVCVIYTQPAWAVALRFLSRGRRVSPALSRAGATSYEQRCHGCENRRGNSRDLQTIQGSERRETRGERKQEATPSPKSEASLASVLSSPARPHALLSLGASRALSHGQQFSRRPPLGDNSKSARRGRGPAHGSMDHAPPRPRQHHGEDRPDGRGSRRRSAEATAARPGIRSPAKSWQVPGQKGVRALSSATPGALPPVTAPAGAAQNPAAGPSRPAGWADPGSVGGPRASPPLTNTFLRENLF